MSCAPPSERVCPACGASLEGRRADARYCTGACRAEASRLERLLAGKPVDGYTSLIEYMDSPQKRTEAAEKRPQTRTDRARLFVRGHVRWREGSRTQAATLFRAYEQWCGEEATLSYSGFVHVLDDCADFDDRIHVRGARGRPRLAYAGLMLERPASESLEKAA